MWAIRRASIHLRNRCLSLETSRICTVKSEIGSCYFEKFITEFTQPQVKRRFGNISSLNCSNSSLAGDETRHEYAWMFESDELSDELSSLLSSLAGDETRHENESMFESDELSVEVCESDADEKKSPKTEVISEFTQVLLSASAKQLNEALDKWVEAGNEVTATEVSSYVRFLQNRRLFAKAFNLYEWLESRQKIEFTEHDYSCRVDFIAKVQGTFMAEKYIQQIPESFRTEAVYTSLLRNCVLSGNVNQSEKLFSKMKDLFPLTCISCNQMLSLYMKMDRKKIADILEFMEKENIKPSMTTYQILIDVKGQSGNIWEMEQVFERMKSYGVEPNLHMRASMAKYYAASGLKEKAEAVAKDMEGCDLVKNRAACYHLLTVYASLGRGDEVGRIWKECESNPSLGECIVAVKAFGQLKRIEEAEAVFAKMLNTLERRPSSYLYAILLDVYADHKMVTKGEDLFRRMRESRVTIGRYAWDALVKLYVRVGKVEKADAVLEEVTRPSFASLLKILEGYANRGDVQKAEKIFSKMKKAGYTLRLRPYRLLLYAYINAKTPVDSSGMRRQMFMDNNVPDQKMERVLAQICSLERSRVGSSSMRRRMFMDNIVPDQKMERLLAHLCSLERRSRVDSSGMRRRMFMDNNVPDPKMERLLAQICPRERSRVSTDTDKLSTSPVNCAGPAQPKHPLRFTDTDKLDIFRWRG